MQPQSAHRLPLDSSGSIEAIVTTLATCAQKLCPTSSETLAVAIPGPFDYATGIGRFRDVGKFDALAGVHVGQALRAGLAQPPPHVAFVNDAEAFGMGEWLVGAARGCQRAVAITLGTGVGSAFIQGGKIVSSGPYVPPGGHVHRLIVASRPLEETVSRRAIIAAYRSLALPAASTDLDVHDIAVLALGGDRHASRVFAEVFRQLGAALRPWLTRFGAQVLVVGGGISASWALIEAPLRHGFGPMSKSLVIVKSADSEITTAAGAAWHSRDYGGYPPTRTDPYDPPGPLTSVGPGER